MKVKQYKNGNQGSTLIIVVIIMAFVAILASTLVSMAFINLQARNINKATKSTFYTVEGWYEQLSTVIANDSVTYLSESYDKVKEYAKITDIKNQNYIPPTNEHYNIALKNEYVKTIITKMYYNAQTTNGAKNLLSSYLDRVVVGTGFTSSGGIVGKYTKSTSSSAMVLELLHVDSADIKGNDSTFISKLKAELTSATAISVPFNQYEKIQALVFRNVEIGYTVDGYTQIIKSDITLNRPPFGVNFNDSVTAFNYAGDVSILEYALVAAGRNSGTSQTYEKGNILANASIPVNITVDGSIYAGQSIVAANNNKVAVNGQPFTNNDVTRVITNVGGVIEAKEGGKIDFGANNQPVNVWAHTVRTGEDIETRVSDYSGAVPSLIQMARGTMYIKDDLELNEDKSEVKIKGSYIGYRGYGDTHNGTILEHGDSSAVLINGKNTSLDLEKYDNNDKLVIRGRAYIDIDRNNKYQTGESVSIKGNQYAYYAEKTDLKNGLTSSTDSSVKLKIYSNDKNQDLNFENLLVKDMETVVYTKEENDRIEQGDIYTFYNFNSTEYPNAVSDFFHAYSQSKSNPYFVFNLKDSNFYVNKVKVNYPDNNIYASGAITKNNEEYSYTSTDNSKVQDKYTSQYNKNKNYWDVALATNRYLDRFYFAGATFENPIILDENTATATDSVKSFSDTQIAQTNVSLIGGTMTDEDLQKPYLNAFEDVIDVETIKEIKEFDSTDFLYSSEADKNVKKEKLKTISLLKDMDDEDLMTFLESLNDKTNEHKPYIYIGVGEDDPAYPGNKVLKITQNTFDGLEAASGGEFKIDGLIITTADIVIDLSVGSTASLDFRGTMITSGDIIFKTPTKVTYTGSVIDKFMDFYLPQQCLFGLQNTYVSTRNTNVFDSQLMITNENWHKYSK